MNQDYSAITIGGPCKITDGSAVFYTEGDATLEPQPTYREVPSATAGEQDALPVDLHWKLSFQPKAIWNSTLRAVLLPTALHGWSTSGAVLIGAANRAVTVLGSDGEQFAITRGILTKMPDLYLGLGGSLYGGVEYTCFLGNGKAFADADAFFTQTTGASYSQADFPTGHQEAECQGALGAVGGFTAIFAEEGFKLTHELGLNPVKQGNVTVDYRVEKYRARVAFKPQQPTTANLIARFPVIGTRLSVAAADLVIAGSGISVTGKSMNLDRQAFHFDNKLNRHGEVQFVTALQTPGTRLVFA